MMSFSRLYISFKFRTRSEQTKIIIVNWVENEFVRMINTTKISPQNLGLLCCIHQQCNFLLPSTHTQNDLNYQQNLKTILLNLFTGRI